MVGVSVCGFDLWWGWWVVFLSVAGEVGRRAGVPAGRVGFSGGWLHGLDVMGGTPEGLTGRGSCGRLVELLLLRGWVLAWFRGLWAWFLGV